MLVRFEDVSFGYLDETLFENATFTLSEGDRVGFIGANGVGKTTLIKLILGDLSPTSGVVARKNGIRIGYLPQTCKYDSEKTVFEEMQSVFAETERDFLRLKELQTALANEREDSLAFRALSQKLESVQKKIDACDGYNYEVKIRTVLSGMGFQNATHQTVSTMSGGEKTRLKLCRLLLEEPELLVLDEPTNHLDVKTLFWLEEYLSSYKGAIFLVSHDRYFLDKTVREIYELENKKVCTYKGNYTKYKTLKAEKLIFLEKEYKKQCEERKKLQEYVDKNLARASTTKSAQSRRNKLEKMEILDRPPTPPTPPRFCFSYTEKPYEETLTVQNLTLDAGEKRLFENLSFSIRRGEKCAVVGDNGTGKTTLLKRIFQDATDGVKKGRFVKYAYYDQENANLDPNQTVLRELWDRHPLWTQTKARSQLALVTLTEEDVQKKVRFLSGGERAKLALAVFSAENGNFLLLDEPTNHLDLPARESLESALQAFDGTVLFVSHDRYFISAIASSVLELDGGKGEKFQGGYEAYTAQKRDREKEKEKEKQVPAPVQTQKNQVPAPVYRSKEEKKADTKKRVRIAQIETEITDLEGEEQSLGDKLATPEYVENFEKLQSACLRLDEIKRRLDQLYEEYETLLS